MAQEQHARPCGQVVSVSNPFRDKLLSLSVGRRTRDRVREFRREDGVKCKATTDELGNTVTEHATKDDRVDVTIRPQPIRAHIEELRRAAK